MIKRRHVLRSAVGLGTIVLALSMIQCRPGILDNNHPDDPCFCGEYEASIGAGTLRATVRTHGSGTMVTAAVERRGETGTDTPVEWQALLYSGEVTRPGTAEGQLTVLLPRSEELDDYLDRDVSGVVLRLDPIDGACDDRNALTTSFDYLDLAGESRSQSLALLRTDPCPY